MEEYTVESYLNDERVTVPNRCHCCTSNSIGLGISISNEDAFGRVFQVRKNNILTNVRPSFRMISIPLPDVAIGGARGVRCRITEVGSSFEQNSAILVQR